MTKYLITSLMLLSAIAAPALAQTDTTGTTDTNSDVQTEVDAGLTPDNPFYFLDTLQEKLSLFFTFNQQAKLELRLKIAEEKLAEAKAMSQKQDAQAADTALNEYNDQLDTAAQDATALPEQDQATIEQRIAERMQIHQDLLKKVAENAPEAAQAGLKNALENSTKHYQAALDKLASTDPQKAADIAAEQADRRLQRAEDSATSDTEETTDELNNFQDQLQTLDSINQTAADKGIELQTKFEEKFQKHLQHLKDVQAQLPAEAQQALDAVITKAQAQHDAFMQRLQDRTQKLQDKIQQLQDQGLTTDQIKQQFDEENKTEDADSNDENESEHMDGQQSDTQVKDTVRTHDGQTSDHTEQESD